MGTRTFLETAYEILKKENRPMSPAEIVSRFASWSFTVAGDKNPSATMRNQINIDIKLKGNNSKFIKVKSGKFGLREWVQFKKIVRLRKGTLKDIMYRILKNAGKPMVAEALADIAFNRGLLAESGEKQVKTIISKLSTDIKKLGDRSLFVQLGKNKFGLREWSLDVLTESIKAEKEKAITTIEKGRPIVGAPMDFGEMIYEPIDKVGVIFLFSKIQQELGIKVEKIQPSFPEAKCLKKTKRGWEVIWLGFEYKSSDFKEHQHDQKECDMLICWKDDWKDRPSTPKVIELKKIIQDLKKKEGKKEQILTTDFL